MPEAVRKRFITGHLITVHSFYPACVRLDEQKSSNTVVANIAIAVREKQSATFSIPAIDRVLKRHRMTKVKANASRETVTH